MIVRERDIGGATVRRIFRFGAEHVRVGQDLTREQVLAIPHNNRQALIDGGMIAIYPPQPGGDLGELHVVSKGFGKYDVFEGRKVNDEPLQSKEEAEALVASLSNKTQ